MGIADEYRSDGEFLAKEWAKAYRQGRLPKSLCSDAIGGSYVEAVALGALIESLTGIRENNSQRGLISQGKILWTQQGSPHFNLTASAAAAFVLTDTAGLRWEDVRMPFDRFLITLPDPSPITFDDYNGNERSVCSIFVQQCSTPNLSNTDLGPVMLAIQDAWNDQDDVRLRAYVKNLKEAPTLFVQASSPMIQVTNPHTGLASFVYEGIHRIYKGHTDPNETLATWCDPDQSSNSNWQSERSRYSMSLVCRLVASLCLYLDHSQGPAKWDKSKIDANRSKGRGHTCWDIGREIKLPKDLREAARNLGRADRHPTQWALQSRKIVRGHWRNQPCGKGFSERRRKWIEPYFKGPETGDVIQTLYSVGRQTD